MPSLVPINLSRLIDPSPPATVFALLDLYPAFQKNLLNYGTLTRNTNYPSYGFPENQDLINTTSVVFLPRNTFAFSNTPSITYNDVLIENNFTVLIIDTDLAPIQPGITRLKVNYYSGGISYIEYLDMPFYPGWDSGPKDIQFIVDFAEGAVNFIQEEIEILDTQELYLDRALWKGTSVSGTVVSTPATTGLTYYSTPPPSNVPHNFVIRPQILTVNTLEPIKDLKQFALAKSTGKALMEQKSLGYEISYVTPITGIYPGSNIQVQLNTPLISPDTFALSNNVMSVTASCTGNYCDIQLPVSLPASPLLPLYILSNGLIASNIYTINVNPLPIIQSAQSEVGIGIAIQNFPLQIAGGYFGATNGTVTFANGLQGVINEWTDSLISVNVPFGATGGAVTVTTSSGASTVTYINMSTTLTSSSFSITPNVTACIPSETLPLTAILNGQMVSAQWSIINNVTNIGAGNATYGTINKYGVYTAPTMANSPINILIAANIYTNYGPLVATCSVVIQPDNNTITLTPNNATVALAYTQSFTVSNHSKPILWFVNDILGGSPTWGTVTQAGLYQAPSAFPGITTVFLTAQSSDGTEVATVPIQLANNVPSNQIYPHDMMEMKTSAIVACGSSPTKVNAVVGVQSVTPISFNVTNPNTDGAGTFQTWDTPTFAITGGDAGVRADLKITSSGINFTPSTVGTTNNLCVDVTQTGTQTICVLKRPSSNGGGNGDDWFQYCSAPTDISQDWKILYSVTSPPPVIKIAPISSNATGGLILDGTVVNTPTTVQFSVSINGVSVAGNKVTWSIGNGNGSTIDANGLFTAPTNENASVGNFVATVSATYQGVYVSNTATVNVTFPATTIKINESLTFGSPITSLCANNSHQFNVFYHYTLVSGTGSTPVTKEVTSSSLLTINHGTITNTGLYASASCTAVSCPNTVTITAVYEGTSSALTATTSFTVTNCAPITLPASTLVLTAANSQICADATDQLSCIYTYYLPNGEGGYYTFTQNVTSLATYNGTGGSSVNGSGVFQNAVQGVYGIYATYTPQDDPQLTSNTISIVNNCLTGGSPYVISVVVTVTPGTIYTGNTSTATAVAYYSNSTSVTTGFTWTLVNATGTASMTDTSSSASLTGVTAGYVYVEATIGGVTGSAQLNIINGITLTVSPSTATVYCPFDPNPANADYALYPYPSFLAFISENGGAPTLATNVGWSVNGVVGGTPTYGGIDVNGNFYAPFTEPTNNIVTVTASYTDAGNNTYTANATVTLLTPSSAVVTVETLSQINVFLGDGRCAYIPKGTIFTIPLGYYLVAHYVEYFQLPDLSNGTAYPYIPYYPAGSVNSPSDPNNPPLVVDELLTAYPNDGTFGFSCYFYYDGQSNSTVIPCIYSESEFTYDNVNNIVYRPYSVVIGFADESDGQFHSMWDIKAENPTENFDVMKSKETKSLNSSIISSDVIQHGTVNGDKIVFKTPFTDNNYTIAFSKNVLVKEKHVDYVLLETIQDNLDWSAIGK